MSIMDKPLFDSLQSALCWAWYGSIDAGSTVGGPGYVRWQTEDKRQKIDPQDLPPPPQYNPDIGGKPHGADACAQAAMIKSRVAQLPAAEFYHVIAKFLIGRERVAARVALQPIVLDIMQVVNKDRDAAALLLARFYGKRRITVHGISKDLKLPRRRVTAINNALLAEMDAISVRAESALYQQLKKMGVLL